MVLSMRSPKLCKRTKDLLPEEEATTAILHNENVPNTAIKRVDHIVCANSRTSHERIRSGECAVIHNGT